MEVSAKIQELEQELKVLKAEIRNVLLDIREVILDRTNPLAEEHESAFIRMDLNTTARAVAAETAAREATKVMDQAPPPDVAAVDVNASVPSAAQTGETWETAPMQSAATPDAEAGRLAGAPGADAPLDSADIPPMYMARNLAPLSGNAPLSDWLASALAEVGPQELERIIAIHRLWGALPPNISRALAYLQELLRTTEERNPRWLKVMQDLDRLASL
jgi:hypothetical protein